MTYQGVGISAFADEAAKPWRSQLRLLKDLGLNYLEIRFVGNKNVIDIPVDQHRGYRGDLDEIGVKVSAVGSPIGKVKLIGDDRLLVPGGPSEGISFEQYLTEKGSAFQRALAIANAYGTDECPPKIRAFSLYLGDDMKDTDEGVRSEVLRFHNMLGAEAKKAKVKVVSENERDLFGDKPENLLWLMWNMDKDAVEYVRIAHDSANYTASAVIAVDAYDDTHQYVDHMHVKDSVGDRNEAGELVVAVGGERFVLGGQGDGGYGEIIEMRRPHIETCGGTDIWTLEPHLGSSKSGKEATKFKGDTDPVQFSAANQALRLLLKAHEVQYR